MVVSPHILNPLQPRPVVKGSDPSRIPRCSARLRPRLRQRQQLPQPWPRWIQPSDPKSECTQASDQTQVLDPQEGCGETAQVESARLGAQLGQLAIRDPDLAVLVASWEALPEHVRATIRTILRALRTD